MERNFYHGIFHGLGIEYIERMLKIIAFGGLKSRRLQGVTSNYGFNGFCFMISDDIPVIKTRYNEVHCDLEFEVILKRMRQFPEQRFSDMFDEWQVRDEISLNHIIGIGIPFDHIERIYQKSKQYQEKPKNLINIAYSMGWDIANTSDDKHLLDYEKSLIGENKANSQIIKRRHYE